MGPGIERRRPGLDRRQPYCEGGCVCQGGALASECRLTHTGRTCRACDTAWQPVPVPTLGKRTGRR